MSTVSPAKTRIGAIGCGQFMSQQHIQTVARSDQLVLQHLVDIEPNRLSRIAARYHPVRKSTRWEDVTNDPEVDVVVIGVLPSLHPVITRTALASGKSVYVEKPLAPTVAECLEVDQLSRACKQPVAVGFNRRFAPATLAMAEVFQAAGAPVSVYYRIADDDRIRPPEQSWKTTDRLLTETVHIFDLLAFLLAADPVEIYARESRPNDALITVEYANGSRATILSSSHGSLAQPKEHLEATLGGGSFMEMDDFVEVRSYGLPDRKSVETFPGRAYDDCDNRHVQDFAQNGLAGLSKYRRLYEAAMRESGVLADSADATAWAAARKRLGDPPPPQINYAPDKGWGAALEAFCASVACGQIPANANARDGNRATTCAVAARESITTGQAVTLDPSTWNG